MLHKKSRLLLPLGLLVLSLSMILTHYLPNADLLNGTGTGVGIGLMLLSLILATKQKRQQYASDH